MDHEGLQKGGSSNPSAMLNSVLAKRAKLQEELRTIETQVYDMETSYLQDPTQCGNVLKGYEGFLSSSKNTALYANLTPLFISCLHLQDLSALANWKRSRKFQHEDRLFSLSSVTSPAAEELAAGRDDGRSDFGVGRSKGGFSSNGPGKPKRGRGASRDTKKHRHSSELDYDYEEDTDLTF
ncbi:hypothetical protein ACFE04_031969 [Oxalis oulophora]